MDFNKITKKFGVSKQSKLKEARYLILESGINPNAGVLNERERVELKNLLLSPNHHHPSGIDKRCHFQPNIQFDLETNTSEKLTILLCQDCDTWKFVHKRGTYFGNYDGGVQLINEFINKLLDKRKRNIPNRNYSKMNEVFHKDLLNAIIAISDSTYLKVNTNSTLSKKTNLKKEKVAKITIDSLKDILLDRSNYQFTNSFRICAQPITEEIICNDSTSLPLSILLKSKCNQVTFISKNESLTIDSPVLISKIHNIL